MDGPPEPVGEAASPADAEARLNAAQVIEDDPEQSLGHDSITDLVGMGEAVAARRGCSPDPRQPALMMPEGVADIVEPDGVGQLAVEHGYNVASRAGRARSGIDAVFASSFPTRWPGMKLQSCAKILSLLPVGVTLLWLCFFTLGRYRGRPTLGNLNRFFPLVAEQQKVSD
jgi:hypothetical protein